VLCQKEQIRCLAPHQMEMMTILLLLVHIQISLILAASTTYNEINMSQKFQILIYHLHQTVHVHHICLIFLRTDLTSVPSMIYLSHSWSTCKQPWTSYML
jgi:hypothetical protein